MGVLLFTISTSLQSSGSIWLLELGLLYSNMCVPTRSGHATPAGTAFCSSARQRASAVRWRDCDCRGQGDHQYVLARWGLTVPVKSSQYQTTQPLPLRQRQFDDAARRELDRGGCGTGRYSLLSRKHAANDLNATADGWNSPVTKRPNFAGQFALISWCTSRTSVRWRGSTGQGNRRISKHGYAGTPKLPACDSGRTWAETRKRSTGATRSAFWSHIVIKKMRAPVQGWPREVDEDWSLPTGLFATFRTAAWLLCDGRLTQLCQNLAEEVAAAIMTNFSERRWSRAEGGAWSKANIAHNGIAKWKQRQCDNHYCCRYRW